MTTKTKKKSARVGAYKKQNVFYAWTRVDMLIALYERAITTISETNKAMVSGDNEAYAKNFLDAQKTILAIHSGLKPDEHEVAFNVARLLHFCLQCMVNQKFEDALKVLTELHSGFQAIEEEANALEAEGKIPPMPKSDTFRTTV